MKNSQHAQDTLEDADGKSVSRREFVRLAVAGSVSASVGSQTWAAGAGTGTMPMRTLGKTGQKVSALGLGGFHIGTQPTEQESINIIRKAIDGGITFMDNCWDYNGGASEIRMGKALRDGYRARVFLMSKIDGRSKAGAARQIDDSLRRLQTDHVDLMQFHEIIRTDDPDRIFAPGGAAEAMLEARKAGKVRYIGFTGHKDPDMHLKMLDVAAAHQVHFDAVQMPLNVMDAHFRSFAVNVVPRLVKEGIGVLGMKPLGSGILARLSAFTPIQCLQYAMNLPTSVVITGIDSMSVLEQALEAGRTFRPLSAQEMAALRERSKDLAGAGRLEKFKTTSAFDGTSHNPQWLE